MQRNEAGGAQKPPANRNANAANRPNAPRPQPQPPAAQPNRNTAAGPLSPVVREKLRDRSPETTPAAANDNRPRQARPAAPANQAQPGPAPRQAVGSNAPSPGELRRQLRRGGGEARIAPPEARHPENELARRAAQGKAPPRAAALAAGAGAGEITQRRITEQNARRSNQDFRNRIGDPRADRDNAELRRALDRRERELRQDELRMDRREQALDRRDAEWRDDDWRDDEWRRQRDRARNETREDDDDNDTLKDIGKILLAGAAGMAVGKLLDGNRQVALNTGDRLVMTMPDGSQQVVRDDNALLYQPGSDVRTENFEDGSSRTTVLREDGSRVVTIRDANANVLRRTLIRPDGTQVQLIDDTVAQPVRVATLPQPQPVEYFSRAPQEDELRAALLRESAADRRFTLGQIRDIPEVRALVAPVNVPQITFDSGSAALASDQAEQLSTLGKVIREAVDENPNEIFMIEGYTDAVGSRAANLALSDRRAESLALALTEYFQVPAENMVVQGYGEEFLLVQDQGSQRENRRVGVRRITDLLEQGS